jgi:hypothetical protein
MNKAKYFKKLNNDNYAEIRGEDGVLVRELYLDPYD